MNESKALLLHVWLKSGHQNCGKKTTSGNVLAASVADGLPRVDYIACSLWISDSSDSFVYLHRFRSVGRGLAHVEAS